MNSELKVHDILLFTSKNGLCFYATGDPWKGSLVETSKEELLKRIEETVALNGRGIIRLLEVANETIIMINC